MADVALYFDDSGFGGTAGSEDGWAAVANWQAGLSDGDYPTLSHLIENGWEDDLPGLEADIQSALKDDSAALGAGKASLEEFLSVLQDRADGDSAVAITLNEETEVSPTIDEPLPADNAKGGKGMPSAAADVTPAKACAIVRDGGVHDASGKWRPLTQAQRGMFGALCGQAKGKKPTTHEEADLLRNAVSEVWNEQEVEEPTEIVDGTPLDESLTVEDIVAMYDASPAPNETNEEHVLALASVAERINGAARHPETGQFTSPEPTRESKPSKSPHLGEHSSTAYEATKKVKPGKGHASDSISYSKLLTDMLLPEIMYLLPGHIARLPQLIARHTAICERTTQRGHSTRQRRTFIGQQQEPMLSLLVVLLPMVSSRIHGQMRAIHCMG
jgi:hypothetical protein